MLKNYYLACIFFKSFYSLLLIAKPRQSDCGHCAQNLGNDNCIQLGVTGMPAWPGSHRKYPVMSSTCGKRLVLESVLWYQCLWVELSSRPPEWQPIAFLNV